MWTEFGGPQSPESLLDKIRADVAAVEADESRISVVESDDGEPMGSVNFPLTVIPSGGHPPPGAPVSHRTR